jgi:hypothetical protein
MIRHILTLVLIGCLALPATEGEATGGAVLVVSSFKCDYAELGTINSNWEEYWLPVFQELVDEGMIDASGTYYHLWGDEWNVNWYIVSEDVPAFLDAYQEGFRRISTNSGRRRTRQGTVGKRPGGSSDVGRCGS